MLPPSLVRKKDRAFKLAKAIKLRVYTLSVKKNVHSNISNEQNICPSDISYHKQLKLEQKKDKTNQTFATHGFLIWMFLQINKLQKNGCFNGKSFSRP